MKNIKSSTTIITFLVLALSTNLWSQENKLITSFPFTIDDYHQIYIKVKVNEKDSLTFNIDTGASSIIIEDSIARNILNLKFDGKEINVGASSTSEVLSSSNNTLSIGDINIKNQILYSIPYKDSSFDGIIGCEFFMDYVVSINYDSMMIYVYDKENYKDSGSRIKFDVKLFAGRPLIKVDYKVKDVFNNGWFLLDTGAEDSFSFNSPNVEKLDLENNLVRLGTRISTDANGNKAESMVGLIEEVVFSHYSYYNLKTGLSNEKTGSESKEEYAGSFGNQLLRKFNIVYDLGNNCLYLKPKLFD